MVVRRPRFPRDHDSIVEISTIKRVFEMKVLGVTFTDTLSMSAHIKHLGAKSAQTVYALRTLRAHGLCGDALWRVTRAHIISRLTYASSAWWGFCNAGEQRCWLVTRDSTRVATRVAFLWLVTWLESRTSKTRDSTRTRPLDSDESRRVTLESLSYR